MLPFCPPGTCRLPRALEQRACKQHSHRATAAFLRFCSYKHNYGSKLSGITT